MNKKALKILEYEKIIHLLVARTTSDPGAQLCKSLKPSSNINEIKIAQTETEDALLRILKKGRPNFSGVSFVDNLLNRLEAGSYLNIAELLKIADLLEVALRIKNYGKKEKDSDNDDSLSKLFRSIEPAVSLKNELRRCIVSDTELADDASNTLSEIRKNIKACDRRVHSALNTMINGNCRTYLQDPVITMRDGRYCLPVKAEYKSKVSGIVCGSSSSGSTLFIEPISVVNIDNERTEFLIAEDEEIKKILIHLSSLCNEHRIDIVNDFEILKNFDFVFAKGSLAIDMNAVKPFYNEKGYFKIKKGRHPLLKSENVVPIDLELGKDFHQLIITGPNTGGKTVSLKTAGLLSLMGQSGLHIPAGDRSELCIFNEIYTDIGDEQSIEQSLSTFSSHMKNIIHILEHADNNCLILFDELCSGTDPSEGAALAIAILKKLSKNHVRTMATTHYSELKVYALSQDGVCNASCEFDINTLRPTYRILMGVPGKSNAFAIASKLGLSNDLICEAKSNMKEESENLEDLLSELENSRISIEREKNEITRYKEESKRLKEEIQNSARNLEAKKQEILEAARLEADNILSDAKKYADSTIKSIRKLGKENGVNSEIERQRDAINKKIKSNQSNNTSNKPKRISKNKKTDFHIGDSVNVISLDAKGTVSTIPDDKGDLYIQMGIIRTKVNITDVEIIKDLGITGPGIKKVKSGKTSFSKSLGVQTEINLLGKNVDEATCELDKYLDDAFLAHLEEVRVVHGKGTGALRKGIHSYLKHNKHVKSFRLGSLGEGDSGVTIVTIK